MTAKKKATPEKKAAPKKRAVRAPAKPKHPLMINAQAWDQQKVMDIVCERIASSTKSIITILGEGYEGNTLPTYTIFKRWLADDESLVAQYARAKVDQEEYQEQELIDIADNATNDYMERNGEGAAGYVLNGEHIQRSRLRIETRKWLMGKLKPKKYGDKVDLNHGVQPEDPIAAIIARIGIKGCVIKPREEAGEQEL